MIVWRINSEKKNQRMSTRLLKEVTWRTYLSTVLKMLEDKLSREDSRLKLLERRKLVNLMRTQKRQRNLKRVYWNLQIWQKTGLNSVSLHHKIGIIFLIYLLIMKRRFLEFTKICSQERLLVTLKTTTVWRH